MIQCWVWGGIETFVALPEQRNAGLRPAPRSRLAGRMSACRTGAALYPGTIQLMDYRVDYRDLLTLCPQWDDLFVKETLKF